MGSLAMRAGTRAREEGQSGCAATQPEEETDLEVHSGGHSRRLLWLERGGVAAQDGAEAAAEERG